MSYVDGSIIPVPKANRDIYLEFAKKMSSLFKSHGALHVMDAWEDDVPEGKVTSFDMAVQKQDDEAIVYSWIVWPSKEVRDEAWGKMMEDPLMQPGNDMPFDGMRMIFGGFKTLHEA